MFIFINYFIILFLKSKKAFYKRNKMFVNDFGSRFEREKFIFFFYINTI